MLRVGNVVVVVSGEAKEWEKRAPRGWARAELFNVGLRQAAMLIPYVLCTVKVAY